MGRKPKCTVEEKISAVEDYLNGIRSVSEIMVDLSIKSTRTIRNWILAYQNGGIEASALLQLTIPIPVNLKLKWFGSISTGKDRLPIYAPDTEFQHMQHYKNGFRCIMPIENLGIMIKREVYMAEARRKTTLAERKEIVEYCITHNRDYKGTASLYDVSYSQVYSWVRKYDTAGEDGLSDKRGHHKTDDEVDELERLRRENLRLKRQLEEKDMVVELLKKVKEFEGM